MSTRRPSPRAPASSRSSTRTTTAGRSCCPAIRARCSIPPRSPRSRRGSATTSSRVTARRCSAPTTRPAWPRSWRPSRTSGHRRSRAPRSASAFTVDEEVGRGTDHFDLEAFGAEAAYTLDGSGLGELEIETFSARQLKVHDRGPRRASGDGEGQARQRRQARRRLRRRAAARLALAGDDRGARGVRPSVAHRRLGRGGRRHADRARPRRRGCSSEHTELVLQLAREIEEREPRARVTVEIWRSVPEHAER